MYLYGNLDCFRGYFRLNLKSITHEPANKSNKNKRTRREEFHWFIKQLQTKTVSCIRRSRKIAKKYYSLNWIKETGLPIGLTNDAFFSIYSYLCVFFGGKMTRTEKQTFLSPGNIILNNYSSSLNGFWVNSPWRRRPNGLLTLRPWGREEWLF